MTDQAESGIEESVAKWLSLWRDGNDLAVDRVTALVYQDLRRLAAYYLSGEGNAKTLQPTALVHEAYLKVAEIQGFECENRAHFIAVVAQIMRRILVDHARSRNAQKRNAGPGALPWDALQEIQPIDLLSVDQALDRLAAHYPRRARIVELRFFGGLEFPEIAEALEISLATVERDWRFARAWLQEKLTGDR